MGVNHGGDKNSGGENSKGKFRWWGFVGHDENKGESKGEGKNEGVELMLAPSGVTVYRFDVSFTSWCTSLFLAPKTVAKMGAAGETGMSECRLWPLQGRGQQSACIGENSHAL